MQSRRRTGGRPGTTCAPIVEDFAMLDESIMLSPISNTREVEVADGRESLAAGLDSWALSSKALEFRFEMAGNLKKRNVSEMSANDGAGTSGTGCVANGNGHAFGWTGKGLVSTGGAAGVGSVSGRDGSEASVECTSSETAVKQSHIKTVVRVRPVAHDAAAGEEQLSLTVLDNSTVQTTAPPEARAPVPRKQYQFAKVLDAVTTQEVTFAETVEPLLTPLLDLSGGRSGLVIAYGATNAGKTHTIVGGGVNSEPNNEGILPRTLAAVYAMVASPSSSTLPTSADENRERDNEASSASWAARTDDGEISVGAAAAAATTTTNTETRQDPVKVALCSRNLTIHMRVVEVYNNQAYDLLTDACDVRAQPALVLKQLPGGRDEIKGLSDHVPADLQAALRLVRRARDRAETARTALNASSSRGHTIWMIELQESDAGSRGGSSSGRGAGGNGGADASCSRRARKGRVAPNPRLWIVDLAGSERSERAGSNTGEASHINKDHSALFWCLNQTASNRRYVSFRARTLTRMLMDMLTRETAAAGASSAGATGDALAASSSSSVASSRVTGLTPPCVMIVNVHPAASEYWETQQVLQNAVLSINTKPIADARFRPMYSNNTRYGWNGHFIRGGAGGGGGCRAAKRQRTSAAGRASGPGTPAFRSTSSTVVSARRRTRNDPSADTAACDVDGSLEEVLGPSGRGAAMPMASGSCRVRHDLQTTQAQVIAKLQVEVERLQDMLEDAEVREVEIEEQTRREVQQPLIADIDQLEARVEALRAENLKLQQRLNDRLIEDESSRSYADKRQEAAAAERQRKTEAAAAEREQKAKALYANLENRLAAFEESEEQVTRLTEELEQQQASRAEDIARAESAVRAAEDAAAAAAETTREALERAEAAEESYRKLAEALLESERKLAEFKAEAVRVQEDAALAAQELNERAGHLEKALATSKEVMVGQEKALAASKQEKEHAEEGWRGALEALVVSESAMGALGKELVAVTSELDARKKPEEMEIGRVKIEQRKGDNSASGSSGDSDSSPSPAACSSPAAYPSAFVVSPFLPSLSRPPASTAATTGVNPSDKENQRPAGKHVELPGPSFSDPLVVAAIPSECEQFSPIVGERTRRKAHRVPLREHQPNKKNQLRAPGNRSGEENIDADENQPQVVDGWWTGKVSAEDATKANAAVEMSADTAARCAGKDGAEGNGNGRPGRGLGRGRTRRRPLADVAVGVVAAAAVAESESEKFAVARLAEAEVARKREENKKVHAAAEKERKRRLVGATTPKKPMSKREVVKVKAGEKALLRRSTRLGRLQ